MSGFVVYGLSMPASLLAQLNLAPAQLYHLSGNLRSRVLNFLLRWEAWDETLACLNELDTPNLVTLQDMQAEAFVGIGHLSDAIAVMQRRLQQKDSATARAQVARVYLAANNTGQALKLAKELVATNENAGPYWSLLGDIYLQSGDLAAAEKAFLQHQKLAPSSRQPPIGLMHIHHRHNDLVTAAAYAVRAFTVEEGQYQPTIPQLRELRDYFAATGDEIRLRAANEQLDQRFADELAQVSSQVAEELGKTPAVKRSRSDGTKETPAAPEPPRPIQVVLPDLSKIPVSEAERSALLAGVQQLFGFTALLPAQTEIMACARRGEHVLAILPTGAGKSLCYQLPAFLDEGVTLVISPLIALMKDQVDGLPDALRNKAIAINSSLDGPALNQAMYDIAAGHYKLVYAAPERLRQLPFLHALRQGHIARLVIDEAHCVSVWGHDFRPDYLNIAQAHRDLGAPPILAMTATAPPRVRHDIERQLFGAPDPGEKSGVETKSDADAKSAKMRLIATDVFRPNLQLHAFKVRNEDEKLRQLIGFCTNLTGSGIVYGRTRQRCEELAELLRRHGVNADHYHAGINNRAEMQERFMQGQTQVMVATIAFGMGIDKADIRFIIHYGLPDSVEAYYQEIGRAGRDGQPARCVLLYSTSDKALLTSHAKEGILEIEFLRNVYRVVRSRLNGRNPGAVPIDDLIRDLQTDDTTVRVALSTLEQVGLLVRHYDAPRAVSLQQGTSSADVAFQQFVQQVRLPANQIITRNYLELASMTQMPVTALEANLLAWQQKGWLRYQASGRDLLLTLPPAPAQAGATLESLLDQFATIQRQRVIEIVDYARSGYCRHGYLASYLGGAAREKCNVCDNCGAAALANATVALPDENEQLHLILSVLDKQGWGKRGLIGLLRGDTESGERAQASPVFGKLGFRSESSLGKLIDTLIAQGAVAETTLSHGGIALGITPQGRKILRTQAPQ